MTIDLETFSRNSNFHGVKGVIRIGENIVTIRRDTKTLHYPLYIDLPGGGREGGESPFETLQREIFEELNITLSSSHIVYAKRYVHSDVSDADTFFMVTQVLDLDPKHIEFKPYDGGKGLLYELMTLHEFIHHPEAVEKQKQRVLEYLQNVQETYQ